MFGSRLKTARERAGLNQTELGKLIGVEQQQINRWESEKNMPNIDAVSALARKLNVSADFLLGLAETLTGHIEYEDDLKPSERRALTYWRLGDKFSAIKAIVEGD